MIPNQNLLFENQIGSYRATQHQNLQPENLREKYPEILPLDRQLGKVLEKCPRIRNPVRGKLLEIRGVTHLLLDVKVENQLPDPLYVKKVPRQKSRLLRKLEKRLPLP